MICSSLANGIYRVACSVNQGDTTLPEWTVPDEWKAKNFIPTVFEERLKEQWGVGLADLVLEMPREQIHWLLDSQAINPGKLTSAQSIQWRPSAKQFVPKFLLFDSPACFVEALEKVSLHIFPSF